MSETDDRRCSLLRKERESVHGKSPSSQDSNSLSLLTEMSGVDAPVPLRSVSVLQSLASGLPKWRGEVGNKCGWWRLSWWELSGELSCGRREGSCCSLRGGRDGRVKSEVPHWCVLNSAYICVQLKSESITPKNRSFHVFFSSFLHNQHDHMSFLRYLFFADAARSLWRRFLNQLPTCVGVSPVAWAKWRFLDGLG